MNFLWRSKHDNKASSSKLWKNIAYVVGTYVIWLQAPTLTWEMLLVYLAVIGGSEVAMKVIELRWPATTTATTKDKESDTTNP